MMNDGPFSNSSEAISILGDAINWHSDEASNILLKFIEVVQNLDQDKRYKLYLEAFGFPKMTFSEFVLLLEQGVVYGDTSLDPINIEKLMLSDYFKDKVRRFGINADVFGQIYLHLYKCALYATDTSAGDLGDQLRRLTVFAETASTNYLAA